MLTTIIFVTLTIHFGSCDICDMAIAIDEPFFLHYAKDLETLKNFTLGLIDKLNEIYRK